MMSGKQASVGQKVPKLRFPGFVNEWEEASLGEVCEKPMYGMNAAAKKFDGENIYLRITDIDESSRELKSDGLTSPDALLKEEYRLKEGDILFARTGASVGKSYLFKKSDGKLFFAGFLIRFSVLNANPYFIYLQTLKRDYSKWVVSVSMRSGQPGINAKEYESFKFYAPTLPEQQKIAGFLGAADEWIGNLRAQKKALEAYKKGMMQKLFSQEIRFNDENGNDFPEWEEKKLGECLEYEQPTNYIVKSTEYDNSYKVPVLTAGKSFILGHTNENDGIFQDNLPVIIFDDFTTASQFVTFPFKVKSSAMKILSAKEGVEIKFIYEGMQRIKFEIGGHGRHWISVFSKLSIPLPSHPEQQKITDFLSAIDALIEAKQNQITKAEEWKKGLMQRLFV